MYHSGRGRGNTPSSPQQSGREAFRRPRPRPGCSDRVLDGPVQAPERSLSDSDCFFRAQCRLIVMLADCLPTPGDGVRTWDDSCGLGWMVFEVKSTSFGLLFTALGIYVGRSDLGCSSSDVGLHVSRSGARVRTETVAFALQVRGFVIEDGRVEPRSVR